MKQILLISAAALMLTACNNSAPSENSSDTDASGSSASESTGNGNGVTAVETSGSSGGTNDDFAAACLNATNSSPTMCACLAEKAEEDLSEGGREFLIASMNEDNDRVLALRGELGIQEMSVAGMFLVTASTQCAEEGRQ
ncbi:hypothetical protein [Hyphobacterium sp.]|uniref:hypothetical protein n=1 Tax=Hyphobacterium sp. TaxID=2004662 RepID=UPI003BA8FF6C